MKNLLLALVFFVPLAVSAEDRRNLPSRERLQLFEQCCVPTEKRTERSLLGELKQSNPIKQLLRKRRLQIYAVEPSNPERGRLDVGRHGREIGFYYRKETGILDGSR